MLDTRCRQCRKISNISRAQDGTKYCLSRRVGDYFQPFVPKDLWKILLSTFLISKVSNFIYLSLLLELVYYLSDFIDKYVVNCITFSLPVRKEMKRNRKLQRKRGINREEQVRSLLLSVGRLRQRQIAAISSALIFDSHPRAWGNRGLRWTIVKISRKRDHVFSISRPRVFVHLKF